MFEKSHYKRSLYLNNVYDIYDLNKVEVKLLYLRKTESTNCPSCNSTLKNVYHFLMVCEKYKEIRDNYLSKLSKIISNFKQYSEKQKLLCMLNLKPFISNSIENCENILKEFTFLCILYINELFKAFLYRKIIRFQSSSRLKGSKVWMLLRMQMPEWSCIKMIWHSYHIFPILHILRLSFFFEKKSTLEKKSNLRKKIKSEKKKSEKKYKKKFWKKIISKTKSERGGGGSGPPGPHPWIRQCLDILKYALLRSLDEIYLLK